MTKLGIDSAELRRMLARWPTGVCVITTAAQDGTPIGKAANSFHTVSMEPALVSWCVDVGSTRYEDWVGAPGYVVHILSEEQLDLVGRFARKGGDKFADLAWTKGPFGMPLLENAALRIVCQSWAQYPAGDHTYLVGEILTIEDQPHHPLLFHGGKTRTLGDLLSEHIARLSVSTPTESGAL